MHLLGLLAHQGGRHDLAGDCIGQAVRLRPDDAEAHNNLGVVLKAQGKLAEAVVHYGQAARLRPDYAEAHNNLGVALQAQGKPEEALASFDRALQIRPDYVEAHHNQALALKALGRLDEAITSNQQVVRLQPNNPEAHLVLGNTHKARGNLAEAVGCYREALHLKSDYVEAHHQLAIALVAQRKREEAVASLQAVVRLQPDHADVYHSLGLALLELDRLEEAVASLRQAVRLRPDQAAVHHSLGIALLELGAVDESVACFREALRLEPSYADAHNNLGIALKEQGKLPEAVASLQEALRLQPDHAEAHNRLAMTWLLMGNFAQGWTEYEWRWRYKHFTLPPYRQPLWDGTPLEGKTILLHAEQGFGDVLQFIRYAPLVKECGGRVHVACKAELLCLLADAPGIDQLVALDAPLPAFDVFAPLMSLPWLFETTLATVPIPIPYLFADPQLVESWRAELDATPGFKVGIAWQGNRKHLNDRNRSVPLAAFAPLALVHGVRLYSLQKGPGSEQLRAAAGLFPLTALGDRLNDFADSAAVVSCLDLIVSVDTALAHLAGAMGVPVWIALPCAPEWRWLTAREDSPWYPTARLFRQTERGRWEDVFARMAGELKEVVAGRLAFRET